MGQLEDSKTLRYYHIKNKSTLHLITDHGEESSSDSDKIVAESYFAGDEKFECKDIDNVEIRERRDLDFDAWAIIIIAAEFIKKSTHFFKAKDVEKTENVRLRRNILNHLLETR